jgi:rhodanese-related sulfurtransferase
VAEAAVDRMLGAARERLGRRVGAHELDDEVGRGALVVDTRPEYQRCRDGELPGAVVVERNVLEWRLDPTSPHRLDRLDRADRRVVVVCDEGYASSLAAASLRDLGLLDTTDLEGGFQAWRRYTGQDHPLPGGGGDKTVAAKEQDSGNRR